MTVRHACEPAFRSLALDHFADGGHVDVPFVGLTQEPRASPSGGPGGSPLSMSTLTPAGVAGAL